MIMNFNAFKANVRENLTDYLPSNITEGNEVVIEPIIKINDRFVHALSLKGEGSYHASPIIYLENYYQMYCDCEDFESVIKTIAFQIMEAWDTKLPDIISELSHDKIQDKLIFTVVNTAENEKFLQRCCHSNIEDLGLSLVFYIQISDFGRVLITNEMIYEFGYEEISLKIDAVNNMRNLYEPLLQPMSETLFRIAHPNAAYSNMLTESRVNTDEMFYVLTDTQDSYGASVLFYDGIKEKIGEILNCDYYVIPSSSSEVIIAKANVSEDETAYLKNIKKIYNSVMQGNELSKDVYKYECKFETLSIVDIDLGEEAA